MTRRVWTEAIIHVYYCGREGRSAHSQRPTQVGLSPRKLVSPHASWLRRPYCWPSVEGGLPPAFQHAGLQGNLLSMTDLKLCPLILLTLQMLFSPSTICCFLLLVSTIGLFIIKTRIIVLILIIGEAQTLAPTNWRRYNSMIIITTSTITLTLYIGGNRTIGLRLSVIHPWYNIVSIQTTTYHEVR